MMKNDGWCKWRTRQSQSQCEEHIVLVMMVKLEAKLVPGKDRQLRLLWVVASLALTAKEAKC